MVKVKSDEGHVSIQAEGTGKQVLGEMLTIVGAMHSALLDKGAETEARIYKKMLIENLDEVLGAPEPEDDDNETLDEIEKNLNELEKILMEILERKKGK